MMVPSRSKDTIKIRACRNATSVHVVLSFDIANRTDRLTEFAEKVTNGRNMIAN